MNVTNVQVSRDDARWEVTIKGEISGEALERYRTEALSDLQKTAKLDGFRPGKAPIDRIVQVYGEESILREAAELAIKHELPELLAKENVLVIESPKVTTDTPESGKPLHFSATASLVPKVELADYKKISEAHREITEDTSVSEDEQKQALTHLRRERARIDKIESGTDAQKASEESRAMKEEELPELDDTFVQSLGYESAEKFAEALKTNIKNEKEIRATEKRRSTILDELVKESKVSYPAVLREYELDDMEARFKDDLERAGTNFEAYLKEIKKTYEELRKTWEPSADNRAKVRLILSEIARKENIEPPKAELDHEIEHAREHYPQANPEALRAHIAHAMRNEMTLRFLEGNTEPVGHTAHQH
jgi:trigger factor